MVAFGEDEDRRDMLVLVAVSRPDAVAVTPVEDGGEPGTGGEQREGLTLPCQAPAGSALELEIVQTPIGGELSWLDQGTGRLSYLPASGYSTPDGAAPIQFAYRARTLSGAESELATGSITVAPPPESLWVFTCLGEGVEVDLGDRPQHGALHAEATRNRASVYERLDIVVLYMPQDDDGGTDPLSLNVRDANAPGQPIELPPERDVPRSRLCFGLGVSQIPGASRGCREARHAPPPAR